MILCTVDSKNFTNNNTHKMFSIAGDNKEKLLSAAKSRIKKEEHFDGDGNNIVFLSKDNDERIFALIFRGSAVPQFLISISFGTIEVIS